MFINFSKEFNAFILKKIKKERAKEANQEGRGGEGREEREEKVIISSPSPRQKKKTLKTQLKCVINLQELSSFLKFFSPPLNVFLSLPFPPLNTHTHTSVGFISHRLYDRLILIDFFRSFRDLICRGQLPS